MALKKLFGDISKVEDQDDGTIKVWGIASTEAVDSDGETITADCMRAALPGYMKFGAVREMHQAKAAGTALSAEVQDDGQTLICAHVVDAEAIKKVKSSVYKGFSIGGRVTARDDVNKTIIKGLNLIEVSLVDRPANPEAVITCYKAEAIEKGMYSVSCLSECLSTLAYLTADAQWESECEGDNSPIPQKLREWLSQGAEILKEIAVEEIDELVASVGVKKAAATADDIQKAGSRNSKSDQAILNQVMQLLKQLGAEETTEDDGADKVAKAELSEEVTAKVLALEDIKKACGAAGAADGELLTDFVSKLASERDTLTKRVKELEAMPAPAKAVVTAVTKSSESSIQTENEIEPIRKNDGSIDETATAFKAAFAKPFTL